MKSQFRSNAKHIWIGLILVSVISCGLTEYEHKVVGNDRKDNAELLSLGCGDLQPYYVASLKPFVENKCLNCHRQGRSAGHIFALNSGQDDQNIATLNQLFYGDYEKVVSKTTGEISHVGGALLNRGEGVSIKNFFAAYQACNGS